MVPPQLVLLLFLIQNARQWTASSISLLLGWHLIVVPQSLLEKTVDEVNAYAGEGWRVYGTGGRFPQPAMGNRKAMIDMKWSAEPWHHDPDRGIFAGQSIAIAGIERLAYIEPQPEHRGLFRRV